MGSPRPQHTCPRCGYDVSGVVPTWTERCPLDGTCSECGLGFAWMEVMQPGRVYPRWSFEHSRDVRLKRFFGTLFRTFLPGRFWREMRLEALIKPWRLGAFAAIVVMGTYLAITLMWGANGYVAARVGWIRSTWLVRLGIPRPWATMIEAAVLPFKHYESSGGIPAPLAAPAAAFVLWCLLIPVPFLLLGTTMRRARCRRAHLWRAWVYFLPTPALIVLASGAFWTAVYLSFIRGWMWGYSVLGLTWLLSLLILAWCVWWWYVLVSHYLRLDHPKAVTALLLVSSLLAAIAVVAYLPGEGLINDVGWLINRWLS